MTKPLQNSNNRFIELVSYTPLLWVSLSFLCGVLTAGTISFAWFGWLGLGVLGIILAILVGWFFPQRNIHFSKVPLSTLFLASMCLAGFFFGAARYQSSLTRVDQGHIAWYNDRGYETLVTGYIADLPDVRDNYTNLRISVKSVDTGVEPVPVSGLLLVRVFQDGDWHYGDMVRLRGHLETPPQGSDFSYRDYLARQGILSYMPDGEVTLLPFSGGNPILQRLYSFKAFATTRIYKIFPDPEAALMAGILLGNDNGIPASLEQAYKNTGTAHIIAISGFNIAIISGVFLFLFTRLLGRIKGAIVALIGIVVYVILVGAGASVVRAAIMGGLSLFASQVGRRQHGLNSLALTAAVMAMINPNVLWDVGFQLSFAATLGLVLYATPFREYAIHILSRFNLPVSAERIAKPLSEYFLFTLAAQVTTLPIIAYQFRQISLVSLIANPFILPVQPAVMILGGIALLISFIYLPLGRMAAWIAWPFVAYTNRMVEFFNRIPHGTIILGEFSFILVVLFYACLLYLTFAKLAVKKSFRRLVTPVVLPVFLGLITFVTWSAAFSAPDGRLHLTFFNVGSADAVLIQTPGGRTILVNGGESTPTLSDALGQRSSPFNRGLDWLVVASTQEQQVAALPRLVENITPLQVLWSGSTDASDSANQLNEWLVDTGVPVTLAMSEMTMDLGKGAQLEILSVTPRGMVLLVSWNGFRALLPMGMNFDTLAEFDNGRSIGPVSVLLLADSGWAQTNPPEWIASLQPQLSILSVAADDTQGLPDLTVLNSLSGRALMRTDRNGWIRVTTDGEHMWVEAQKTGN